MRATSWSSAWPATPICAPSCAAPTSSTASCVRRRRTRRSRTRSSRAYFAFQEKVTSLREPASSHRYLALRRGQSEGELQVAVSGPPEDAEFEARLLASFEERACTVPTRPGPRCCGTRGGSPSRTTCGPRSRTRSTPCSRRWPTPPLRRSSPRTCGGCCWRAPFGPKPVLGIDPGIRTGCKLVTVDAAGAFPAARSSSCRRTSRRRRPRRRSCAARASARLGGGGRERHRRA